jgi:hypothetical protein
MGAVCLRSACSLASLLYQWLLPATCHAMQVPTICVACFCLNAIAASSISRQAGKQQGARVDDLALPALPMMTAGPGGLPGQRLVALV